MVASPSATTRRDASTARDGGGGAQEGGARTVALEIPVVEVMKIAAGGQLALEERAVEAVVPARGRERRVLRVEDEVERVRRHRQMYE